MMVMAAGQMIDRIAVARLGRVMIVGVIQFGREFAEHHVLMLSRCSGRVLDLIDGARQGGSTKHERERDAQHRDQ